MFVLQKRRPALSGLPYGGILMSENLIRPNSCPFRLDSLQIECRSLKLIFLFYFSTF